jgi:DNA-binding NtrC family response regulator
LPLALTCANIKANVANEHKTASPEETERADFRRERPALPSFRLVVVDGPDAAKEVALGPNTPPSVLVGTGPACDLVLADRMVSRRHLSLEAAADHLRLVDLGSTNGTTINGIGVVDARLRGGEHVRVGQTTMRVDLVDASSTLDLWPLESFGRLLGVSVAMRRMYPLCQKFAASTIPLVIEGETGTGKELLAESLHEMGSRRNHPFVVVDCAALDRKGTETVLFGEQRRGPKGGVEIRKGVFEEARGGTLLLDHVGELSLVIQAQLLRAIARREICRVGGDEWLAVDVRLLATTQKNLDREVELGRFREDLFFRLATARLELPPLRKREGDVAFLAAHFYKAMADSRAMPAGLLASLEGYAWPGNVRELENLIARKIALGDLDALEVAAAPLDAAALDDARVFERIFEQNLSFPEARARVVAEFERFFVERILAKHGGNVSRAAAASGIARRYFQVLKTRHR